MSKLDKVIEELEEVIAKHFGSKPALAVAFTLAKTNYKEVNWITNVNRGDGIKLFTETAAKMRSQMH